jgi:hypothetical protein
MIDNLKDLTMRTEERDGKGQSTCCCVRCAFERYPTDDLHTTTTLQAILDLAILQTRYDDAMEAIEGLVRLEPKNATWLFTRARIAGWQHDFLRREQLLQTAALVCLNDKVIDVAEGDTCLLSKGECGTISNFTCTCLGHSRRLRGLRLCRRKSFGS